MAPKGNTDKIQHPKPFLAEKHFKEYVLPYGWLKQAQRRISGNSNGIWDITVFSPTGKGFRSNKEIEKFILENPNVPFSPELTRCNRELLVEDLKKKPNFTPSHQAQQSKNQKLKIIAKTPNETPKQYQTRSVSAKKPKRLFGRTTRSSTKIKEKKFLEVSKALAT